MYRMQLFSLLVRLEMATDKNSLDFWQSKPNLRKISKLIIKIRTTIALEFRTNQMQLFSLLVRLDMATDTNSLGFWRSKPNPWKISKLIIKIRIAIALEFCANQCPIGLTDTDRFTPYYTSSLCHNKQVKYIKFIVYRNTWCARSSLFTKYYYKK